MKPILGILMTLTLWANTVMADELFIVRSSQNFEEAMSTLQNAISKQGYKVTRVQRVDVGLEAKGYKTDRYRVVFYGKPGEIEALSEKYPTLIPYLPLSVAIFAEGGNTLLATSRPNLLQKFYTDPALAPVFARWEKDLSLILDTVRETK